MTDPQLLTLDGQPLTSAVAARTLSCEPGRLATARAGPAPIDAGDIVEAVVSHDLRRGDIVMVDSNGSCRLARLVEPVATGWLAREEPGPERASVAPRSVLGVVTTVEKADLVLDLRRGRWMRLGRLLSMLPPRAGRRIARLALLERLRHPFFPPLSLGTTDALLAQLRATYEQEVQVIAQTDGLTPEEEVLLGRWLRPGMRLLDVGCGAGREAIGFARAGLVVTGIDIVPAMIAMARARAHASGVSATFEVVDALAFAAAGTAFDAIYLPSGIYAHIPGRARRIATMRRLARALVPGGVIVLTATWFEQPTLLSRTRLVDAVRGIGRHCGLTRLSEPGDQYHRSHGLVRAPASFRYVHRFAGDHELMAELDAAGLAVTARPEGTPFWIVAPGSIEPHPGLGPPGLSERA